MHSQSVPQVDLTRSASPTGVDLPPAPFAHGHGAQQPPDSSNIAEKNHPNLPNFRCMTNPVSLRAEPTGMAS